MMYSAYKLNKQGDNTQPWCTHFPIRNQSVVPCPVLTVASWPAYRFFRRWVKWSGIPISLRIFHSLLWSTQPKALAQSIKQKQMFFWNSLTFSMIHQMLAIWSLGPLPFLNPTWTSGSSLSMYSESLAWRILSITLLACEMSAIVWEFENSLALPFFGIGKKTDLFQSCGHCWVFQICWHIECSPFTASSFRIWNSSTGIHSLPLALFIVMLPKAHLTSHFRMSGSRWVIMPSWLSGLWRSSLYSSSVYSWNLFLISSASVRSIPFPSFIEHIFAWNVPLLSLIFLKRSLVFSILLFHPISLHWSLRKVSYLSLLFFGTLHSNGYIFPFLLCLLLLFFSQLFVTPPQTTAWPSVSFFLGGGFGHCLLYSVMNLCP